MRRNCILVVTLTLKQYLGTDGAKIYCQCTVDKLSEKFNDEEIDEVFKKRA